MKSQDSFVVSGAAPAAEASRLAAAHFDQLVEVINRHLSLPEGAAEAMANTKALPNQKLLPP